MSTRSTRQAGRLAHRLLELLVRIGAGNQADDVRALLLDCHSSSGRFYHDLFHVEFCLSQLDEVANELHDPASAELALWFGQAVLVAGADDNALHSALLFDTRLGVHLPTRTANRVHAMIMTATHGGQSRDIDARFVADVQRSRLAQPWPEFAAAAELLRKEYAGSSGPGAEAFFDELLARPSIYLTDRFRQRCERQARRNIEAAIAARRNP